MNQELNELQKEVTRRRILETGFRVFAEQTIEKVRMTDVAKAAGLGTTTVYRYYKTKPELAVAVSTWAWENYLKNTIRILDVRKSTAAEEYEFFLDAFLDLYRHDRSLLRFNQFFNVYIENEKDIPAGAMQPYIALADLLAERFDKIYRKAQEDGTLRTDLPAGEIFLPSLHLMLAAVTRYAVGLVYGNGSDSEKELILLKNMLLKEFTKSGKALKD